MAREVLLESLPPLIVDGPEVCLQWNGRSTVDVMRSGGPAHILRIVEVLGKKGATSYGQAERQPTLHIVQYHHKQEAGGVDRTNGKHRQSTPPITVIVVRPTSPKCEVLESIYQILSATQTA